MTYIIYRVYLFIRKSRHRGRRRHDVYRCEKRELIVYHRRASATVTRSIPSGRRRTSRDSSDTYYLPLYTRRMPDGFTGSVCVYIRNCHLFIFNRVPIDRRGVTRTTDITYNILSVMSPRLLINTYIIMCTKERK